jgi:hypothetical protein
MDFFENSDHHFGHAFVMDFRLNGRISLNREIAAYQKNDERRKRFPGKMQSALKFMCVS